MRSFVTADDVLGVVRQAAESLGARTDAESWARPAGDLTWTCRETVDHTSDDLFAYALQLSGAALARTRSLPVVCEPRRDGGPALTIATEDDAGIDGVLANLEGCGALLAAMVRTAGPDVRGHHVFGVADAEGFAAMGLVEVLIHTYDVAAALDVPWSPDHGVCERVLARLFPDVPADLPSPDPWQTLLWACGRIALPPMPRRDRWRWYGEPPPTQTESQTAAI